MTVQKKICRLCHEQKPEGDFYKNPSALSGRDSRCKECAKAAVRKNRKKRIEYYREYDRNRTDDPKRVAARRAYQKSHSKSHEGKKRWIDKNRVKRRAHIMVGNALKYGNLSRPDTCERCGEDKDLAGHHENYFKPLEVTWLCRECHGLRHREINEAIRNGENWKYRGF